MSIYSNVTEQDLINLRELAKQQKEQRALKIINRILKQTHDIKLAESLSPITKNLDTINESSKKIGEVINDSNSNDNIPNRPNSSKFTNSIRQMLGSLMNSRNSPKNTQDESGRANILGVPIEISEADTIKINEDIYQLTPEIYKALSSTTYTGKTIKNEDDILMMYDIVRDLGYTGVGDKKSNRKTILHKNTS